MTVTIAIHEDRGITAAAEIDVTARKVTSLTLDDERLNETFIGLAVLSGCVEAILDDERRRRAKA